MTRFPPITLFCVLSNEPVFVTPIGERPTGSVSLENTNHCPVLLAHGTQCWLLRGSRLLVSEIHRPNKLIIELPTDPQRF